MSSAERRSEAPSTPLSGRSLTNTVRRAVKNIAKVLDREWERTRAAQGWAGGDEYAARVSLDALVAELEDAEKWEGRAWAERRRLITAEAERDEARGQVASLREEGARLRRALGQIAAMYSEEHAGTTVTIQYAGSMQQAAHVARTALAVPSSSPVENTGMRGGDESEPWEYVYTTRSDGKLVCPECGAGMRGEA